MKLRQKKTAIPLHNERERQPVPIVSDGAIAIRGFGEGRLIPVLILDTTDRPDLEECVRVHDHLPPGDVTFQWGDLNSRDDIIELVLQFKRPMELVLILSFDIIRQGGLVDQILTSKTVYIQPGRPGDRLSVGLDKPRILVEIPDTGFQPIRDRMIHKYTTLKYRRMGLTRQQAKSAARRFLEEWRKFGQRRLG